MPATQPTGAVRTLGSGAVVDGMLSADSTKFYAVAGNTVSVIDLATGGILASYTIGTSLGAMDLSADGRYLAVVERQGASGSGTVYRVDLTTGATQAFTTPLDMGSFFDLSFLSDGTALVSQQVPFGSGPLRVLDFTSGAFTATSGSYAGAWLDASADRSIVMVDVNSIFHARYVYTAGSGITARVVGYPDPYAGAGVPPLPDGVHAVSASGSLIARGLSVYDAALALQFGFANFPQIAPNGLAFSPAGDKLYVAQSSNGGNLVIVFDIATREAIATYAVGAPMAQPSGNRPVYGDLLQASADGRYLTVIGSNGVQLIDLTIAVTESAGGDDVLTGPGPLYGLGGNDTLIQGAGFASMYGGKGDDRYIITSSGIQMAEYAGQGYDTVVSSVSFFLPENFEKLVLDGTGPSYGVGNSGDNVLIGNDAANDLRGMGGADLIQGGGGNDMIDPGAGLDIVEAGAGDDTITFTAVESGGPATPMGSIDGGTGYDTIDLRAVAPVTFGTIQNGLGAFAQGLYVGSTKFEIAGVERVLFGNSDDYIEVASIYTTALELRGGGGRDRLFFSGNVLGYGEAGDDTFSVSGRFGEAATLGRIDGGAGIDLLQLNIAFNVDLAAGTAVSGSASYTIASIEHVQLDPSGGYASSVRGTDADETFEVNPLFADGTGALTLDGRGGNDILGGGLGADQISGGDGDDMARGGGGADVMAGGEGIDTLTGGTGADIFVFSNIAETLIFGYRTDGIKVRPDIILDFVSGEDRIDLAGIDANIGTGADDAFSFIGTAAFSGQAGELRYKVTGGIMHIYGDVDGNGSADFEIFTTAPMILATDFVL